MNKNMLKRSVVVAKKQDDAEDDDAEIVGDVKGDDAEEDNDDADVIIVGDVILFGPSFYILFRFAIKSALVAYFVLSVPPRIIIALLSLFSCLNFCSISIAIIRSSSSFLSCNSSASRLQVFFHSSSHPRHLLPSDCRFSHSFRLCSRTEGLALSFLLPGRH